MFEGNGNGRRNPLTAIAEQVYTRLPVGAKESLRILGALRSKEGRTNVSQEMRGKAWELADNTTRAVSAGMGIADVRALFRGDPPVEKPNPRYKVFTNAFFAHIRPRYYEKSSTKFTHTFGLGFMSALTFFVEVVTGTILMVFYIPEQDRAYQSMVKIIAEVPFGQLMRDVHRIGAELMVIFVALHMLRVYLTGSYKHPRQFTWVTGVILLIVTLGLSYSGYLLPWDQLAYWAVTIGTSMAKSAPPKEIMGYISNLLLRGGDTIGQNGLLRFYLLHVILFPALAIVFISVHYYRVSRLHGISLPASEEESPDPAVRKAAKERLDYLPDVLTKELMWIAIAVFGMVAFAAFSFHAPLEHHADPYRTPLHTTAPWYFLWIQGMLKDPVVLPILRALRDFIGIDLVQFYDSPAVQGVIFPTVIFVVIFAIPYIDEWWERFWGRTPSRQGKNRKLGLSVAIISLVLFVVFSYFGTPYFGVSAPPAVEIGQEFIPEECVLPPIPLLLDNCGEVRRLGYEGLPVGSYELAQHGAPPANAEEFDRMLARMQTAVARESQRGKETSGKSGLVDAQGFFVVEDWQMRLKKVTLRITWTPQSVADAGVYEKIIYLHKESAYE
ncbi:MAG: cytochrome b N-terminal domain-containing protein [Chloroflexi bacterium]|nr:cytochrome b N-terminal domain-containing protein [Chloroflexota bacterium]